ncbi:TorF family putative porin [Pontibacterium granulatum]|uniref:TorF family putative porin n=1 Tax=Pontibacterium granulatum TaxID=2036029 RepID=UPI002499B231|nr:TorF family putative porin [Pontibacterium granulatum]MDI3324351.1 TorF family putative porin [Pontibacterium granulatum]
MIRKITTVSSALALCAFATSSQAEVSATATLVSDYVYNGVSQTDSNPALQGSVDWYNDAGFYVGAFASQIDFTPAGLPDAELEFDVYAGYAGSINDDLSFDLGYAYYTYPGANDTGFESDYGEVYGSLTYKGATTLKLAYSDNYSFDVGASYLVLLSHTFDLGNEIGLTLEASHTELLDSGNGQDVYWYGDNAINHWGASLSKSLAGFDMALSYTDTDANDASDTYEVADARVFLSISRTFE